jgi:hypothetical protein
MIVSTKIAKMFKECGFVNIDYLVRNRLETNPSKILNILNRDWRKWVKPLCMFDGGGLDPNFGYETQGASSQDITDRITGSVFTCPEAGTATSITFYNDGTTGVTYKCAIYKHSDLSLIASSSASTSAGTSWNTISISASLEATDYILVVWSASYIGPIRLTYDAGATNQGHYQTKTYNGNFPNPLVPTHENRKYSVYCTYTAAAVGIASKRLLVGVGL